MKTEKTRRLQVRVSPEEHAEISRRAASAGLGLSEYARRCCLRDGGRPRVETDVELLRRIYAGQRHIGGNLNQAMRLADARRQDFPRLVGQLERLLVQVSESTEEISQFIQDAQASL